MDKKDIMLHEKFVEYGLNAKEWINKCKLMLPEIKRRSIWEKKGFGSLFEYAAKLAGLSRGQVEDAIRILRKIKDKPALISVVEKKGINSVRPVVTIATKEDQKFWAGKARKMSVGALKTYVREFRNVPELDCKTIQMSLSPEILSKLEKIKADKSWDEVMTEFIQLYEQKVEKPKKVKNVSRHIPRKIENFIKNRSNGKCEFKGCMSKSDILHHTERFALTKTHDPDMIYALCEGHERLFHQGLINNEEHGPDRWEIRKFPNTYDIKYLIDQKVMKFRSSR